MVLSHASGQLTQDYSLLFGLARMSIPDWTTSEDKDSSTVGQSVQNLDQFRCFCPENPQL